MLMRPVLLSTLTATSHQADHDSCRACHKSAGLVFPPPGLLADKSTFHTRVQGCSCALLQVGFLSPVGPTALWCLLLPPLLLVCAWISPDSLPLVWQAVRSFAWPLIQDFNPLSPPRHIGCLPCLVHECIPPHGAEGAVRWVPY